MKDPIVQEVRDARAAVAADFDFDLHKFFAWAKTHAAAERMAKRWLPTGLKKPVGKNRQNVIGSCGREGPRPTHRCVILERVRPLRVL